MAAAIDEMHSKRMEPIEFHPIDSISTPTQESTSMSPPTPTPPSISDPDPDSPKDSAVNVLNAANVCT